MFEYLFLIRCWLVSIVVVILGMAVALRSSCIGVVWVGVLYFPLWMMFF